jgi:flavin reductase (DIM6/NTAB) family NADH-FMN oxidoreductase RutF
MEVYEFNANPFELFHRGWALVTAGDEEKFNTMTVSWGSMGTLWNKPVVTVYVKPVRYTSGFLKAKDHFTVSFFDPAYKKALSLLGTLSGRDGDKVAQSGLTPKYLENGVTFEESYRTFVLKKIYEAPFVPEQVPAFAHDAYYTDEAEHIVFIGEVEQVL